MLQCQDCEFCVKDNLGRMQFGCNPFGNIKEPECLQKWMLLKLDMILRGNQSVLNYYQKFAPLQEKMMKYLEREIDDIQEQDRWKYGETDDDCNSDQDERLP
jgi:hypothetical protein